jgi:hypothetical protein
LNLPKRAKRQETIKKPATQKQHAASRGVRDLSDLIKRFKVDPIKGAEPLLRLRQQESIKRILADDEFQSGLKSLSEKASDSRTAALYVSRFALRPHFFDAAVAATTAVELRLWPEPSKFDAENRRVAAEALARLRPQWALDWLARAVLGALRYPKLRRFLESLLVEVANDKAQLQPELARLRSEAAATDRGSLLAKGVLAIAAALDVGILGEPGEGEGQIGTGAPVGIDPSELIREAAWSDADKALGRALQDMGRLTRSFEKLESIIDNEAADPVRRVRGASDLVMQWVRQAARQRNITALSKTGERVAFDPVYHELEEASLGDRVRVVKPPIVRGSGSKQVIVVRGLVELD